MAVEADWPDAYRVNRYVRGESSDPDGATALADFRRFPSWMWRNTEVLEFVEWLRGRNLQQQPEDRAGFYGVDLYSLRSSMEAVVDYLQAVDPAAAAQARMRYGCFDHVRAEGPEYGHAVALDLMVPCENEVVAQLIDLRHRSADLLARDGWAARDEFFFAERNAQLVHDAERYYRAMYRGRISSWNLRDHHMADTVEALVGHLSGRDGPAKVVVWAHNSHVGDARATELGSHGELTLGQLVRRRWPDESFLVGFTTDTGTVTAASEWGGPAERKRVRPAMAGSWESAFHAAARGAVPSAAGGRAAVARRGAARAGDRGDLPAGHRAGESLVPRPDGPAVRRRHPPGSNLRGGAAGTDLDLGQGRGAGDLSDRALTEGRCSPATTQGRRRAALCAASATSNAGIATMPTASPASVGGAWPSSRAIGPMNRNPTSITSSAPIAPSRRRFEVQPTAHAGRTVLRQANALATCASTTAVKAAPDAARSVAPSGNGRAGPPAGGEEDHDERGELEGRFDRPQHAERPDEQPPIEQVSPDRRLFEEVCAGRFGAQGERRQDVGPDVEGEHLQDADREREPAARHGPHDEGCELRDVVGQVVGEEAPDVGEGGPSLFDRGDDGREVVVEQDQVGRFTGDVGARSTHRHADRRPPAARAHR